MFIEKELVIKVVWVFNKIEVWIYIVVLIFY